MKNKSIKTSKADIVNLIAVSVVSVICIVFCIIAWLQFNSSSEVTPYITDLKQLRSTDTSVLLSWNCNVPVDRYVLKYDIGNETRYIDTSIPFARLEVDSYGTIFEVSVTPIKNETTYNSVSTICSTKQKCIVHDVSAQLKNGGLDISWNYTGVDDGFDIMAYVVDSDGKRHMDTEKVTVEPGQLSQCRLENVICNMVYTVAVVPRSDYFEGKKTNVYSGEYSKSYNELKIFRTAICMPDKANLENPKNIKKLTYDSEYCVSLLLSGKTDAELSNIQLYFLNENGVIVDTVDYFNISTNPDMVPYYNLRVIALPFTVKAPLDSCYAMLCIDGNPAELFKISIEAPEY